MNNKEIVRDFIEKVFNRHDLSGLERYMHDDYIQHNPGIADGRDAFKDAFENGMFKRRPNFRQEIKHMYCDGDIVVVHLLAIAEAGVDENIVFDVYRLRDGKLAEHWDCIQHLTPAQLPNAQGFF
ncbi:ester cyclase [Ruminococcaceae bacterium OttesenSCG-928-D13]|nr:ester cyclase [Ruminococcaceae bacterium OttesenSCG-928-D13]